MNTKFILPNILKISVISRVRSTSEMADIFNTRDQIFLVFTEKSKFPLREKLNIFSKSFFINFAWLSAFSGHISNIGYKRSLHLETGL